MARMGPGGNAVLLSAVQRGDSWPVSQQQAAQREDTLRYDGLRRVMRRC